MIFVKHFSRKISQMAANVYKTGRLSARPHASPSEDHPTGLLPLELPDTYKPNLLYVPNNYTRNSPAALAVMMHGAGGNAEQGISFLRTYADSHHIIILATASHASSWDVISARAFGADVLLLDKALTYVFDHYAIDPQRVAVGGFSDGASYGLSIGLSNGDLFTHIIAFSPGFYSVDVRKGSPEVFISHGTEDRVLNIDRCSRRIIPKLRAESLKIDYREFNGPHTIPSDIIRGSIDWFCGKNSQ